MSAEIALIQEIEKHPCLYNFHLQEYNRKEIADDKWATIAENCDLTVSECKDKWKNIRSSFVRSLKQGNKPKKPYYLSTYLQFIVPFIKCGVEFNTDDNEYSEADSNENTDIEIPALTTIKIDPDVESDTDPIGPENDTSTVPTKKVKLSDLLSNPKATFLRKKKWIAAMSTKNYTATRNIQMRRMKAPPVSTIRTENNAMHFFLMSLLPEFDTMNEDQVRMFKIKVMMLIDDIKTQSSEDTEDTKFNNDRLQRRLINLLLKNLEQNT